MNKKGYDLLIKKLSFYYLHLNLFCIIIKFLLSTK